MTSRSKTILAPVRILENALTTLECSAYTYARCYYSRRILSRQEHGNRSCKYLKRTVTDSTNGCQNPPLYLRVTSTSKEGLDQAVKMIEEMLTQELPNLVDERRFRRREPENFERDEFGRVSSTVLLSTDIR